MKILHAYKVYYPVSGGIPTLIQLLAEKLQPQLAASVLCTKKQWFDCREQINQVTIHRLASAGNLLSLPLSPHYPIRFWQLAQHTDIVDYHFPMPWVDLAVALYFPANARLVIHWHSEIIEQKLTAKLIAPLVERCLQRAARIIVAGENYIKYSPVLQRHKEKCVVVPFGTDISKWQIVDEQEQQQVNKIASQYPQLVLAVGRLVPYKGYDVLINAMRHINGQLIIVGEGPLAAKLKAQAETLGIASKVLFQKATDQELKCLYHAAKVFAFPSITTNEAFGLVQLEAMACRKPIVNTQLRSAVPEVARHEQEALTVPPGAEKPLADAINHLLQHPDLAKKLGENGYQRVSSVYSLDAFLRNTLAVYESLM